MFQAREVKNDVCVGLCRWKIIREEFYLTMKKCLLLFSYCVGYYFISIHSTECKATQRHSKMLLRRQERDFDT